MCWGLCRHRGRMTAGCGDPAHSCRGLFECWSFRWIGTGYARPRQFCSERRASTELVLLRWAHSNLTGSSTVYCWIGQQAACSYAVLDVPRAALGAPKQWSADTRRPLSHWGARRARTSLEWINHNSGSGDAWLCSTAARPAVRGCRFFVTPCMRGTRRLGSSPCTWQRAFAQARATVSVVGTDVPVGLSPAAHCVWLASIAVPALFAVQRRRHRRYHKLCESVIGYGSSARCLSFAPGRPLHKRGALSGRAGSHTALPADWGIQLTGDHSPCWPLETRKQPLQALSTCRLLRHQSARSAASARCSGWRRALLPSPAISALCWRWLDVVSHVVAT